MNNYQCTGCGVVISADPALTPTVQCAACSTLLSLGPLISPRDQAASAYMDYQCPGCGATNSADPTATPEVHCNTCLTLIKLGQAQPQEVQAAPSPSPSPNTGSSIPELGAASGMTASEPARAASDGIPELGAAKDKLPDLGSAVKKDLPELGGAMKKELPELGGAVKKDLPAPDNTTNNPLPEIGAAAKKKPTEAGIASEKKDENLDSIPDNASASVPGSDSGVDEAGPEETRIQLPNESPKEVRERPAWLKFLLQVRVLVVIFGIAPVMITVVSGAILSFIHCGTGIASGEGDAVMQVGEIVLGLASLWAMYILGMTFYYADRDWVTDFGHFVMIGGGIWGLYAVATTFPATFLAIMGHLFFAYVALAAIALAVWLLAPYKGIGSPR